MSNRYYYMISDGEYSDYCVGGMICTPYEMTQEKWDMIIRRYVVNRIPNLLLMSEHIKANWVFHGYTPDVSDEVEALLEKCGFHNGLYEITTRATRADFFTWVSEKNDPNLIHINYTELHEGELNE